MVITSKGELLFFARLGAYFQRSSVYCFGNQSHNPFNETAMQLPLKGPCDCGRVLETTLGLLVILSLILDLLEIHD